MTSLFKKLSIFTKIGVIKRYGVCLVSFKIVDRIRRQSSRIVFTPPMPTRQNSFVASAVCTHRRRDKTRQFRLIGVGGVYWALLTHSQPSDQRLGVECGWVLGGISNFPYGGRAEYCHYVHAELANSGRIWHTVQNCQDRPNSDRIQQLSLPTTEHLLLKADKIL